MRLVQVLIPEGKRDPVLETLDGEGIDYAVFEETGRGEFEAMVSFPVPPAGVETLLERLSEAGVEEDVYTIVLPTETVVSTRIEALQERFPGLRISREELVARAEDLAPASSTFYAFLVLSTVIATTGLLLDSAATIIGAMVVAPLMGPAISASVGTVLDDQEMAYRGIQLQVVGLLAAIAVAAVLGIVLQQTRLIPPGLDIRTIPQVAERTSPNFLSLFLALGSGLAGAISIIRGAGSALVGVAIAVALIPPAATSGLGIAWGFAGVAVAAAVLVLVNLLAINLSALVLLWVGGYRPAEAELAAEARSAVRSRVAVIVAAIVVLSVVLAAVTFASFQTAAYQQDATDATEAFFERSDLVAFEVVETTVEYTPGDLLFGDLPAVTVVVSFPQGVAVPRDLAEQLDEHLEETTGQPVEVRVGFVQSQETGEFPPTDADGGAGSLDRPAPGSVTGVNRPWPSGP